jgi:hypothetical protein
MHYHLTKKNMKKQISEEISSMKFLLNYKRGVVISEQAAAVNAPKSLTGDVALDKIIQALKIGVGLPGGELGTNEEKLIEGLSLIKDKQTYDKVNAYLTKTPYNGYKSVVEMLNGELDGDNLSIAVQAKEYLKKIGLVLSYSVRDDKYNKNTKYLTPNTFKIGVSSSPETNTTSPKNTPQINTTTDWSKYPCVPKHPNAKKGKTAKGSEYYQINNYYYYDNGRKYEISTKKIINYTCNDPEFKANVSTVGDKVNQKTPIPTELKNIEGVKLFQDWLDVNAQGWAKDFANGILNKSAGYGNFGPRTQKAWNTYGRRFLSKDMGEIKPMETKPITQIPKEPITNAPLQSAQNPVPTVNRGVNQLKPQ